MEGGRQTEGERRKAEGGKEMICQSFSLKPSAFSLPDSSFILPPSAFRLPPSEVPLGSRHLPRAPAGFVARRIHRFVALIGQNSTKMGCVRDARDEFTDSSR
jgi:hypothetical protein